MLSGFCSARFEYFSAEWCSAAETHLKLQGRVVSGACFFTLGVFECDIACRQSVAILCMLYRILCKAMHPLYGALPVPHVPVWVTLGALVAHRYTCTRPRCRRQKGSEQLGQ